MVWQKFTVLVLMGALLTTCKPRQKSGLLDQPAPETFPHVVKMEDQLFRTHALFQDPSMGEQFNDYEVHPDFEILTTVAESGEIGVWNAKERKLVHKFAGPPEAQGLRSIALQPVNSRRIYDDFVLAVGDQDGNVYLNRWEKRAGKLRQWFKMRRTHTGPVLDVKWYFPLDPRNKNEGEYFLGPLLVTRGQDGSILLNAWGYLSSNVWTFGLDRRPITLDLRRDSKPLGAVITRIIEDKIGTPLGDFHIMRDGSIAYYHDNVFEVGKPRIFGYSPQITQREFQSLCQNKGGTVEELNYHNENYPELVCNKDNVDIEVCYISPGNKCVHDKRSIEMNYVARKEYKRGEVKAAPERICANVSDTKAQEMMQPGEKQFITGLGHHRQQEEFMPQFCTKENSDVVFIALDDGTIHTYLHHYQAWLNPTETTGGDFQKTSCFGDRYILDRDDVYAAVGELGCAVQMQAVSKGHLLTVSAHNGRMYLFNRATKHTEIEIQVPNTKAANAVTGLYSENGFFIKPENTNYFLDFDFDKAFRPQVLTETAQVDSDVSESGRYVFGVNQAKELSVFDTEALLNDTEPPMQASGEPLKDITSFRVLRDYNSCDYPRSGKDIRAPNQPVYLLTGQCSGEVALWHFVPDGRTYSLNKIGVVTPGPGDKPDVVKCAYGNPPLIELSEDFGKAVVGHWDRTVQLYDLEGPFDPYNRGSAFKSTPGFKVGPLFGTMTNVEYYGIAGDCGGEPKIVATTSAANEIDETDPNAELRINTRIYSIDPFGSTTTVPEPEFEFDGPARDVQIWDRIYSMIVGFERPLTRKELGVGKDPGNIQIWSLDPTVKNLATASKHPCTTQEGKTFIVRRRLGQNYDGFECNHRYVGHGAGTTAIGFAPYRGPEQTQGGKQEGNRFVSAGGGMMRVWDVGRYRTQIWNLPIQMPVRNPKKSGKCKPYIEMLQMRPMAILGGEEAVQKLDNRIASYERRNPGIKEMCEEWQALVAEGNLFYSIGRVNAIQQRGNLIYTGGEDGLLVWWGNNELEPKVQGQ